MFFWIFVILRLIGIEKVECDVPSKLVTVTGTATDDVIKAGIEKTGKAAVKQ